MFATPDRWFLGAKVPLQARIRPVRSCSDASETRGAAEATCFRAFAFHALQVDQEAHIANQN